MLPGQGKAMHHESFLCVAFYILADVVRSLFAEAMYALAPNRKPVVSITLVVLLIEITKLLAAFVIVLATTRNFGLRDLRHFVLPAGLYFLNNCLYFGALSDASAGGLSLLMHMRLPLTALAHHLLVKKQKSWKAWTSLAFVFIGVSLAQLNEGFAFTNAKVILVILIICANSSVASVVNERTLKTVSMPFWDQQLRMYFFGAVSSAVGYLASTVRVVGQQKLLDGGGGGGNGVGGSNGIGGADISMSIAALLSTVGCVVSGAAAGIITGFVVYKLDNVVKVVSNSFITIIVTVASFAIFGIFPFVPLNFCVGSLILAAASFAYASCVQHAATVEKASMASNKSDSSKKLPVFNDISFAFLEKGLHARTAVPLGTAAVA